MKFISFYKEKLGLKTSFEVFNYLISNLQATINSYDYFVNWDKVRNNFDEYKVELNILNALTDSKNLEQDCKSILEKYPEVIQVIPSLLAYRDKSVKILKSYESMLVDTIKFNKDLSVDNAYKFLVNTGFLDLIESKQIKSIPDYFIGVEAGLDSNGRKNRGGTAMEDLVEHYVKGLCDKNNYTYLTQASASEIKKNFDKDVKVEKSSKRFDFVINTDNGLYIIETNFYNGGGSKLKSTAGEYLSYQDKITDDGHDFIWITDGEGWITTKKPLEDTFNHNDYVLNLKMLKEKILEEIIK